MKRPTASSEASFKEKCILAVSILAIVGALMLLCGRVRSCRAYVDRRPVTRKYMVCSACRARYEVTQEGLMKMDVRQAPRDKQGEFIVPCAQCGRVAAKLVVEVVNEAAN